LTSSRHIAHAEIRNRSDARPLGNNCRFTHLQRRRKPRVGEMVQSLSVGSDRRNLGRLQGGSADYLERCLGKVFAQLKIKFANLRDCPVQSSMQQFLSELTAEGRMEMCHDSGLQLCCRPRDPRDHRIDPIGGSAGHEAYDQVGGVALHPAQPSGIRTCRQVTEPSFVLMSSKRCCKLDGHDNEMERYFERDLRSCSAAYRPGFSVSGPQLRSKCAHEFIAGLHALLLAQFGPDGADCWLATVHRLLAGPWRASANEPGIWSGFGSTKWIPIPRRFGNRPWLSMPDQPSSNLEIAIY